VKTGSFLHQLDTERILAAIREAEARSRGEVRVHVTGQDVADAEQAGAAAFARLGMGATSERNAVLLFVAPASQKFAVLGDRGIHERCGDPFWRKVAADIGEAFREGRYTDGLVRGVEDVAQALAREFPSTGAADVNELPDELTED
jgi:uncharacterized membrane protein